MQGRGNTTYLLSIHTLPPIDSDDDNANDVHYTPTHTQHWYHDWHCVYTYVYRTYFVPMSIRVGMTVGVVVGVTINFRRRRRRRLLIRYSTQSDSIRFDSIRFNFVCVLLFGWYYYSIHHFIHVWTSNLSSFYSVGHIIYTLRGYVVTLRYVTLHTTSVHSTYFLFMYLYVSIHFLIS